jgi:hypothetical protein
VRGSFGEEGQKRETLLAPKTPPTYAGRLRLTAQEKEPGLDVCCCGALRERFSAQRAVGVDLAVHDHGDVGAVFQKLHDVFSFSCHGRPARFCGGILFEAAEASFAKCKIDLLESPALRGFDGVGVVVELH